MMFLFVVDNVETTEIAQTTAAPPIVTETNVQTFKGQHIVSFLDFYFLKRYILELFQIYIIVRI